MKDLIAQGGIVMYPLLAISIIALAITMERFFYFSRISQDIPETIVQQIKENLKQGEIEKVIRLLNKPHNPMYYILCNGIQLYKEGHIETERAMDELKMKFFPKMEKHVNMLQFIAKISPSLGLLGTITGMIKTFHFLSLNVESQQLAQGISEALLTTALGLSISIPALAAYYYFTNKIEHIIKNTERVELILVNHIQKLGENSA
ncbi:MAG TPA: MotA/TolQ/ExbB proton channel family protein [Atribacterota bacterium]|nr:MotA/TolQ/ExbB proton channel family protein [Atribacterota bacterium]HOR42553.1 MotA/TolQ/ExbB proton channel family protein [Atribacterota bacterium]